MSTFFSPSFASPDAAPGLEVLARSHSARAAVEDLLLGDVRDPLALHIDDALAVAREDRDVRPSASPGPFTMQPITATFIGR
jgi:flagellar biosynthesis/type III secretory pathway ATPase